MESEREKALEIIGGGKRFPIDFMFRLTEIEMGDYAVTICYHITKDLLKKTD